MLLTVLDFLVPFSPARSELEAIGSVEQTAADVRHAAHLSLIHAVDGVLLAGARFTETEVILQPGDLVTVGGNTTGNPSGKLRAAGLVVSSNTRRFVDGTGVTDVVVQLDWLRVVEALHPSDDDLADSVQITEGTAPIFNYFGRSESFDMHGVHVELEPLPTIAASRDAYSRVGGIFQTHTLRFHGPGTDVPGTLRALTDTCQALSLTGLTYVFYPEMSRTEDGRPVCRYFRSPITRRRVKDATGLTQGLTASEVAGALSALPSAEAALMRRYIHQAMDATDETVFLETRALSAAVLIERLLSDRVDRSIPGAPSKTQISRLTSALVQFAKEHEVLEGLSAKVGIVGNVRSGLVRIGELGFAASLAIYLQSHDILAAPMRTRVIAAVTRTRNALVHEARFPDGWSPTDQYSLLLWLAVAMLVRASGVESAFSELPAALLAALPDA